MLMTKSPSLTIRIALNFEIPSILSTAHLIKDLELPVRPRPRPGTPDKPREPSSDEPGISVLKPKLIKP